MSSSVLRNGTKRAKHDGTRRNWGGVSINDMFGWDSKLVAVAELSAGMVVLQPIHRVLSGPVQKQGASEK